MKKKEKSRDPRVKKKLKAVLENGTGVIENLSASGGFLKTQKIPAKPFTIELKISEFRGITLECEPQWRNESGVGFKLAKIEETKEDLFVEYVEKQIRALQIYGEDRVFKTEVVVTLKDTNVFGSVYFSNFIEYQGIIREKFLLQNIPDIHKLLTESRIRLVTVDTYNRYIENAYFGDTLVVELTTSEIQAATCRLNITFTNKDTGRLIGEGYQRFCVVSAKGTVIRIPEEFRGPLDFFHELKEKF